MATIIKEELEEVKRKFGDARRTELMVGEVLSLEDEDLIEETDVLITLSNKRIHQNAWTKLNLLHKNVVDVGFKELVSKMMTLSVNWSLRAP